MAFNYNQFYSNIRRTFILQQKNYLRSIIAPLYESMYQQSKADVLSVVLIKSDKPSDAYILDKDAIPAIKDENSAIYPWFYENYLPEVRGSILKQGGNERDAKDAFNDAVTEVYVQVWKGDKIYSEDKFIEDGSPANSKKHVRNAIVRRSIQIWKSDYRKKQKDEFSDENYNINVALDPFESAENYEKTSENEKEKKKRKKRDPIDHAGNKEASSHENELPRTRPTDPFEGSDRHIITQEVLNRIPKDCEKIIRAKIVQKKDYETIAKEFGYSSANYVKSRKHKCMKKAIAESKLVGDAFAFNLIK